MVPQLPWVTSLGMSPCVQGGCSGAERGFVGQGGESLTVVGSDNSSPVLVVLLSCAGALNPPNLICPAVPFLSLCSLLCPQQGPVSPFHQTQEHQPKTPSWCQPCGGRAGGGLVG